MLIHVRPIIINIILFIITIQRICIVTTTVEAKTINGHDNEPTSLKLVQVVFRHGERNPTRTYPNDPFKDETVYCPRGFGELTQLGRSQGYELGVYLRETYDGFLSRQYTKFDVHVTSSDKDRTIMSAQALLAGLFPPNADDNDAGGNSDDCEWSLATKNWNPVINWQLVPIHTIPRDKDSFLDMKAKCPKFEELFLDFYEHSAYTKRIEKENRELIDYLIEHMGLPSQTPLFMFLPFEDTLMIQNQRGMKLPQWLNQSLLDKFSSLRTFQYEVETFTNDLKRLRGGPILKILTENMETAAAAAAAKGDDQQMKMNKKLFIYSAHEGTLAALMNTMGIFNHLMPPYMSCLIFELHQPIHYDYDDEKTQYTVQIFYRNESDLSSPPFQMDVPNCGPPCHLHAFRSLMNPHIPAYWEEECKTSNSPLTFPLNSVQFHAQMIWSTILGIILLLGILVFVVGAVVFRRSIVVNFKLFSTISTQHSRTDYVNLD